MIVSKERRDREAAIEKSWAETEATRKLGINGRLVNFANAAIQDPKHPAHSVCCFLGVVLPQYHVHQATGRELDRAVNAVLERMKEGR